MDYLQPVEPSSPLKHVLELVDDVERHIELLRKSVLDMAREKEALSASLAHVSTFVLEQQCVDGTASSGSSGAGANSLMSPVDMEELKATVERLRHRLDTVHVRTETSRDDHQKEALQKVNLEIEGLVHELQNDWGNASTMTKAKTLYDSCMSGGTGSKFEGLLLSCTSDDQRIIKARVNEIYENARAVSEIQSKE